MGLKNLRSKLYAFLCCLLFKDGVAEFLKHQEKAELEKIRVKESVLLEFNPCWN